MNFKSAKIIVVIDDLYYFRRKENEKMDEKTKVIANFWNEYSDKFDAEHDTEDLDGWRRELKKLIATKDGLKTLDIGTGTGFLAMMLAELGCESYGVDVAEDMLELGRQHAKERQVNVNYQFAAGEDLPFEDETFDAVVNCRVIWTLVDPQISMKEWKRVLKKGGKLACYIRISDAPAGNQWHCYGEEFDKGLPLMHASGETMIAELVKAGYCNCQAIRLPQDITKDDMSPWYAIYGEKEI